MVNKINKKNKKNYFQLVLGKKTTAKRPFKRKQKFYEKSYRIHFFHPIGEI